MALSTWGHLLMGVGQGAGCPSLIQLGQAFQRLEASHVVPSRRVAFGTLHNTSKTAFTAGSRRTEKKQLESTEETDISPKSSPLGEPGSLEEHGAATFEPAGFTKNSWCRGRKLSTQTPGPVPG